MGARILVVGVFVLAAAAAGDALREEGAEKPALRAAKPEVSSEAVPSFVVPRQGRFQGSGRFLHGSVMLAGREYLSQEAVADAFPGDREGPIDISKLAIAPDGALVLAVYRFSRAGRAEGALLFWKQRRLVAAYPVRPGDFGGGLAFDRTGELVALFSHDGALRGVYDRAGRRLEDLPDRFLSLE